MTPMRGRAYLSQRAAGRDWRVSAGAFWQVHPGAADVLTEAVMNALRHAHAKKIEADITYAERLLRLRIRDDGKGIDPKLLDAGRDGHWGLPGMRERAEQIGARLDIWSELGAGTEVDLSVPGAIAYGTKGKNT